MQMIAKMYQRLNAAYGDQHWWPAESPFEVMVGAVLTQNTAWTNVEKCIRNLQDCLTPHAMAQLSQEELAQRIRSSGYYNQKAARLKRLLAWFSKYGYDLAACAQRPTEVLRTELLAINGIGKETADSILLYALGRPVFVIDAYTKRVMSRMTGVTYSDYDALAALFTAHLPREAGVYNQYHALLVQHCKQHCTTKPNCDCCPLGEFCTYRKANKYSKK